MKKPAQIPILLVLGLLLILATQLVRCDKTPTPPDDNKPVEEELEPTLEVFFPQEEIPYGEKNITLSWTTTNTKRVYINGIKRSGESHTILERLFQDSTFVFRAFNIQKETEKEITLNVGDWTTSTFGLVSYYPWRYKAMSISNMEDKVIERWVPSEEERSWIDYYHRNGVMTFSNHPWTTVLWYIKDDSTIVINGTEERLQVDEEEMTLSYQTRWNGQDVWFNMIYEHASTTPTDP